MKRLRFLIIECILATDLKHHFEIVGNFREKVNLHVHVMYSVIIDVKVIGTSLNL